MAQKGVTRSPSWAVKPACGVEVHGLTLAGIGDEACGEVKRQFTDHGVVFFRDVGPMSPTEHLAFARKFGEVNVNRFFKAVDAHPAIAKVEKLPDQKDAIGEYFHTDHSYDLAPAMGSVLVARVVPEKGGDTVFVDMRKAYDSLPNDIKTQLIGLRAVHSSRHTFGKDNEMAKNLYTNADSAVQDNIHPVVIRHPWSGRQTLYVNPTFTIHFEGMTPEESRPLLDTLYKHALQPAHITRFAWKPGSAVMWDNRAVWHCAMNDYAGEHRLMHRVTIEGVRLEAADGHTGSEPCSKEPINVLDVKEGQTLLDLPWLNMLLGSLKHGMANLGTEVTPWWPDDANLRAKL